MLCQVKPFYMDKETSIDRVSASLEKYSALDHLDVVCLPELAFTGYNFEDKQEALTLAARRN